MSSDSEDSSGSYSDVSDGDDQLMSLTYLAAAATVCTSLVTFGVAMAAVFQQQQDAMMEAEEAEKSRKRKTREVRALSAYNAFMMRGIDDLKVDGKLPTSALTQAAEKWRAASDQVKEQWQKEADRLNSERRSIALAAPDSESEEDKEKAKKKLKKKDAPKRARSSFLAFTQERIPQLRALHPDVAHKDVMAMAGEEWHKLNAKQRAVRLYLFSTFCCVLSTCAALLRC